MPDSSSSTTMTTPVSTCMFGMDFGNSLAKVVYFEATPAGTVSATSTDPSKVVADYIKSKRLYDRDGVREDHLELPGVTLNGRTGTLHFLRFPAIEIENIVGLIKASKVPTNGISVSATGQGAYIYQRAIQSSLDVDYKTFDEFTTMAHGLQYILQNSPQDCYYLEQDNQYRKVPMESADITFPYLVVTIGSATSIQLVTSATQFIVIGGSNIGGATFLGLTCLLTSATGYDEAMALAKKGNNKGTVDKLLGAGGCEYYLDRFGVKLSADMEAVAFGHMLDPERRKSVKEEDLARAMLTTVVSVVSTAVGGALGITGGTTGTGVTKVLYLGSFLRDNQIAMEYLTAGMNMTANGAIKAVFLEHEGFCGAVGSLVERVQPTVQKTV